LDAIARRVLSSGRYILGKEVAEMEKSFASYIGIAHAIGVNSGTDALTLALHALGVGNGDEVITVANTATATVSAIRAVGAVPVFVDIEPVTYCMDPNLIEEKITTRTKAIIPVHLFGFPADMLHIMQIARKHRINVIEDCAQAHGAKIGEQKVGTFGDIGCFSFYPTKNIGAYGDAGAIVTSNEVIARKLFELRNYGEVSKYVNVREGFNSRLDEVQAAFISWGIERVQEWNDRRAAIAEIYRVGLGVALPVPAQRLGDRSGVWHLFVVEVDHRSDFMEQLQMQGIETAIHYPLPIYRQEAYSFLKVTDEQLPHTARAMSRIVSLPLFPELTDDEAKTVIEAVLARTV
jgi:dTDP-4-amino-4,6-dideoxygalactose transaminase